MSNRKKWVFLSFIVITLVLIWVSYVKIQESTHISERRVRFWSIAYNMYSFLDVEGHLPVDAVSGEEGDCACQDCSPKNSWRLTMVPYLFQDLPMSTKLPWCSEGLAQVRCRDVIYFHGEQSRWSIVNCVFPGGPGAQLENSDVGTSYRRRLLLVESYPEEAFWMESGDIDLLALLKDKTLTDALHLKKANRSSFMAMFSDLTCCDIKCTIPPKYVISWIRGEELSEIDNNVAKQFILWSKPVGRINGQD